MLLKQKPGVTLLVSTPPRIVKKLIKYDFVGDLTWLGGSLQMFATLWSTISSKVRSEMPSAGQGTPNSLAKQGAAKLEPPRGTLASRVPGMDVSLATSATFPGFSTASHSSTQPSMSVSFMAPGMITNALHLPFDSLGLIICEPKFLARPEFLSPGQNFGLKFRPGDRISGLARNFGSQMNSP